MSSVDTFDNTGQPYVLERIMNSKVTIEVEAYQSYSPVYLSYVPWAPILTATYHPLKRDICRIIYAHIFLDLWWASIYNTFSMTNTDWQNNFLATVTHGKWQVHQTLFFNIDCVRQP